MSDAEVRSISGRLTIGVPESEKSRWISLGPALSGIAICSMMPGEDGDLIVQDLSDGEMAGTPVIYCLACVDPRNREFIEGLKQDPAFRQYFHNASVLVVPEDREGMIAALFGALSRFMAPLVHFSAEQTYALSSLRREYERVHLRFSALESYVVHSGANIVRERLFVAAEKQRNGEFVFVDAAAGKLRQVLPVSSKGLCCIDIFVRFVQAGQPGLLRVALVIGDAVKPEAEWSLTPSAATPREGQWYSLALPRSVEGVPRSAHLEFNVEGLQGSQVLLAAGGLIANNTYCVQDLSDGGVVSNRPIAMRIWEGPPGLLTPRAGNITLSEPRASLSPGVGRVPGTSLQHVRAVLGKGWKPEFSPVNYIPDEEAIGVHPPDSGVCGAIIDDLIPSNALSASATAFIANDASLPVEFALAVADTTRPNATPWSVAPQFKGILAWSGWRSVAPQQRHQLTVLLGPELEAVGSRLSLVMLTRMENGQLNSFAWARFADVTIEEAN